MHVLFVIVLEYRLSHCYEVCTKGIGLTHFCDVYCIVDKQLRTSTLERSKQAIHKHELNAQEKVMKGIAAKRNVSNVRRLTQEELLAEAKITEQQNLRSLGECMCGLFTVGKLFGMACLCFFVGVK
jgi:hypothetical protein